MMIVSLTKRYGAREDRRGDLILLLLHEALAQGLVGAYAVRGASEGLLEFGDGFIHEAHFLVGDAEVVMTLVVLLVDVLRDALLEPLEHLLEVGLLVPGRRL